jgi:hypothetical protein
MKRKYFFVIFFLVLAIFFIINTSSINAIMYKILDSEGNVICLTNIPVLSIQEKEAGCTISPPPEENIEPMQNQTINEQEIKQEVLSGSEKYDFRETNWGMSKEQVKITENSKLNIDADNALGYEGTINGKDCVYVYHFLEDKLYYSGYGFTLGHTNLNLYLDDYDELKQWLIQKYGKPKTDIPGLWKVYTYKGDKSQWGVAISLGHLSYKATWETSTTKINLSLSGGNNKISLLLLYYSKELEE